MGRTDRRGRTALDEAYRYYKGLDSGQQSPNLYQLTKSVKTLSFALAFADAREFKLTRQLWKRLHQALFDSLLTNFSGEFRIRTKCRQIIEPGKSLPDDCILEFQPDLCKRADDINEIEFSRLYPKVLSGILKAWQEKRTTIGPQDFDLADCENGVCQLKPLVLGHEVLGQESEKARNDAYQRWWELYWQAYCSKNNKDQRVFIEQMRDLETVWGNLYY